MLGHHDLEFFLRYGEVTVGKADTSNPSHMCQNDRILYTGMQSQNNQLFFKFVLVLIPKDIVRPVSVYILIEKEKK